MKIYNAKTFVKVDKRNKNTKYIFPLFLKYKDRKKYLLNFFNGNTPIIKLKNKYYKIILSENYVCENCDLYQDCFLKENTICPIVYLFKKFSNDDLILKEVDGYEVTFRND